MEIGKIKLGSRELFVFEIAGFYELHESVAKQKAVVTIVEPESHFIKVSGQVFCADLMPRSIIPRLSREKADSTVNPAPLNYQITKLQNYQILHLASPNLP